MFKRLKLWWALKRAPKCNIIWFSPGDVIVVTDESSESPWYGPECRRIKQMVEKVFPQNEVLVLGCKAKFTVLSDRQHHNLLAPQSV